MARLVNVFCISCGLLKQVAIGSGEVSPSLCLDCQKKEEDKRRRQYLKGLEGLTVEERLARIEELLYDAPWERLFKKLNARY
jgi:hypothetical protein